MKKVLLIDDERDFTELTGTLLGFHDYDVLTLNNPLDVEKALNEGNFDVIVSDLMMPHLDGFELVERIRTREKYKETPVIILSAKTLNDLERKKLMLGNVHFVAKPFEPQALVEKISGLTKQA